MVQLMFMHPVPGPITSTFGPRPQFGFHHGFDHGWLKADPINSRKVYALSDGVVQEVGWNALVGYYVLMRISASIKVRQAHFAKGTIAVKVGQRVFQGVTLIGVMGSSGAQVSGVHLHTDVYVNGVRVDPAPYFTIPFSLKPKTSRKGTMSSLFYIKQSKGNLFALAGDSPGTDANWFEFDDQKLANALAVQHGNAAELSAAKWAELKAKYQQSLRVAGSGSESAASIAKAVNDDAARRMSS